LGRFHCVPIGFMHETFWLWVALALGVFWGVGAYNRLMRLRARALDALGSVEKQLRQHAHAVREHQLAHKGSELDASSDQGLGAASQHWRPLTSELERMESAMKAARASVLAVGAMHELTLRYQSVLTAWDALAHVPQELVHPYLTAELKESWDDASRKVEIARSGLNQIVERYNEAIAQFPASLVVASMGFSAAGPF
jgi:LemA protein